MIQTDAQLSPALAAYDGSPAVFLNTAPEGVSGRYITLRWENTNPGDLRAVEFSDLTVDVYDLDSESARMVLSIGRRIEKLLDNQRPVFVDVPSLGIWREFKGLVPEDDISVQHQHLVFSVRYGRPDLA